MIGRGRWFAFVRGAVARRWAVERALSTGQRRLEVGDFSGALARFDRGLATGGETAPLRWHRALACVAADRPEEAVADVDRAVALGEEGWVAHLLRGRVLVMLGRPAPAVESLDRALAIDPPNRVARGWRAVAHLALDEVEPGLALLDGVGVSENPEVLARIVLELERLLSGPEGGGGDS